MSGHFNLWVYLSASPLTWLGVTLAAYLVGDTISTATKRHPMANPVLIAVALISVLLVTTETGYGAYFQGAQFIHVLLGPATVALAIPMVRNRDQIIRHWRAMGLALGCGALTGVLTAIVLAKALGGSELLVRSMAPKSITVAIAMGISRENGGEPALTAALVMFTGVLGAVAVTPLMNMLGIKDWRARGFAAGLAAHGLGTARALSVHPIAGTFAGLALAMNGLMTALVAPVLLRLLP